MGGGEVEEKIIYENPYIYFLNAFRGISIVSTAEPYTFFEFQKRHTVFGFLFLGDRSSSACTRLETLRIAENENENDTSTDNSLYFPVDRVKTIFGKLIVYTCWRRFSESLRADAPPKVAVKATLSPATRPAGTHAGTLNHAVHIRTNTPRAHVQLALIPCVGKCFFTALRIAQSRTIVVTSEWRCIPSTNNGENDVFTGERTK